jgi:hypothetical protein
VSQGSANLSARTTRGHSRDFSQSLGDRNGPGRSGRLLPRAPTDPYVHFRAYGLGFGPDDLASAPPEVVGFLADQLRVDPQVLSAYGQRSQTRTDHFLAVQEYLGLRKPDPEERKRLARWLLDRALEHDRPLLL